jgi:hypothetical protein
VSRLWSSPPDRLWRQQASRLSRVGYLGDSQWHVWDMYAPVGKCIITFSKWLETFLTTYRTKRRSSSKISDFLSKVTSFYIYSLLNQQIFTIIGKLGQKIPKLHPTSNIASISIQKKFHTISSNLYYTSHIGMNISWWLTVTCVRHVCFSGEVHHHFLRITWNFFDHIPYQKEELQQNFRFFKQGYKTFTFIPY